MSWRLPLHGIAQVYCLTAEGPSSASQHLRHMAYGLRRSAAWCSKKASGKEAVQELFRSAMAL